MKNTTINKYHISLSKTGILTALVGVGTAGMGEGRWVGGSVPSGGDQCSHPVNPACNTGEHSQQTGSHSTHRYTETQRQRGAKGCGLEFDQYKRTSKHLHGVAIEMLSVPRMLL